MEWNCNHCSSQCLREMEDSVCLFVKDFFRISSFPREEVKIYWEKYRKLPTLRFCLPEGRYLVIRQVGPLFRRLGHLCYGMAEFQRLVDFHWYSWAGYYDYWNGRLAIPPQYHSIRNDGEFTAAGYAIVRGKSDWFDGKWQKNYMLIDRTGHNTSGNLFQEIGRIDASDFSMFDPYDELLGYSVRMGTKYGLRTIPANCSFPASMKRKSTCSQWRDNTSLYNGRRDTALFHCRKRVTKMMRSIRRSRNISNKKLRNNVLTPWGRARSIFFGRQVCLRSPSEKRRGKIQLARIAAILG